MASVAEMFSFVSTFGPMLGELATRVDYLERRMEMLEAGASSAAAPGASDAPDESDAFELMGQKFSMKDMLEKGMPKEGIGGLMDKLKNWKAPAKPDAPAATPPATPDGAPPAT